MAEFFASRRLEGAGPSALGREFRDEMLRFSRARPVEVATLSALGREFRAEMLRNSREPPPEFRDFCNGFAIPRRSRRSLRTALPREHFSTARDRPPGFRPPSTDP